MPRARTVGYIEVKDETIWLAERMDSDSIADSAAISACQGDKHVDEHRAGRRKRVRAGRRSAEFPDGLCFDGQWAVQDHRWRHELEGTASRSAGHARSSP